MIEYCLVSIAKMQEIKMQTLTHNLQMVRAETHEEEPSISMVSKSGVATNEDKGDNLNTELWIHKVLEKKDRFSL